MAKTLTQGDIRSWATLKDYWTPLRMTIARASALAENKFVRASGSRHAKCAPFHEHYWTVEQIEKDLDAAGYAIVEKAEMERLSAKADAVSQTVAYAGVPRDPQPKRRGRPPKMRDMQQGAEEE